MKKQIKRKEKSQKAKVLQVSQREPSREIAMAANTGAPATLLTFDFCPLPFDLPL